MILSAADSQTDLILGLSIGIPVSVCFVFLIVFLCVLYRRRRHKDYTEEDNYSYVQDKVYLNNSDVGENISLNDLNRNGKGQRMLSDDLVQKIFETLGKLRQERKIGVSFCLLCVNYLKHTVTHIFG
ncbi:hypothetical protein Btru_032530 [Bulinus truncatus]|nr:hypothetical protein Btru_032530 [Bulinus truncatus]